MRACPRFRSEDTGIGTARQLACARITGVVLALLLLLVTSGCRTECRSLCTAWYDYQRDVCGVVDTDDERVRCIADYKASKVTDAELVECVESQIDLAEISALPEPDNACLCDEDRDDCPLSDAGGDDSATDGETR
ncbi:MAG: hypothetical protein VX498_10540 [Myxococcota bacterium]|nr:hypothetical protein [Myxococcota bacterium]